MDSRAVHAGRELKARDPLGPPIHQTSVHVFDDLEDLAAVASGERPGHLYARNSNESVALLESAIAELEGADGGVGVASGMAALLVGVLSLAPRPAPILVPPDLYGVSLALLSRDLAPLGYELREVDLMDAADLPGKLPGSALLLCETITNPLCRVPDLEQVCAVAAAAGVPVLVDNTFASPVLCRPLALGAAMVMHSVTKYVGGHSDLVAGALVGSGPALDDARARAVRLGTTLGPFEAWLALRGLRTLALRMHRHSENAVALARGLVGIRGVLAVHHPLLPGSPYEAVARRQLPDGAGGMLAFELKGGLEAVQRMLGRLRMVRLAASFGGVETTISHPELTSHRALTPEQRAAQGIGPGTVRVSAGIEAAEDVLADFRQAIAPR